MTDRKELNYDVVILGGGPAGLSAALYAARGALSTAIVDLSVLGGQPSNYLEIENYPGYPDGDSYSLMEKFQEQVDKFNVNKHEMQEITKLDLAPALKIIETTDHIFKAKTIILATGAQPRKLGVNGEKEYLGRGVSYCAVCDGAFYRDKEVSVVGGGNAAVEEGLYLTKFATKVNIIHRRDALRADKIVQDRAFKNPKVNFIWDSVVEEIKGANTVSSIVLKNLKTSKVTEMNTDGVFPYVGFSPNSNMYADQIHVDKTGFVITDANLATSVKGVYAAGDVRVTPLRQVITAAADGAIAATSAIKYLEEVESEVFSA